MTTQGWVTSPVIKSVTARQHKAMLDGLWRDSVFTIAMTTSALLNTAPTPVRLLITQNIMLDMYVESMSVTPRDMFQLKLQLVVPSSWKCYSRCTRSYAIVPVGRVGMLFLPLWKMLADRSSNVMTKSELQTATRNQLLLKRPILVWWNRQT